MRELHTNDDGSVVCESKTYPHITAFIMAMGRERHSKLLLDDLPKIIKKEVNPDPITVTTKKNEV